ncbi:AzlC family ABC transporter permease [Pacificibacter marinus]|uniref:Inner membrane protein YgaZ n=1 Tax=Pacificibacter marinus TaxID=658057 RepID=A0A1Y5TJQ8_9RHOB|nr:AzlC family ABC transporter permease [Pacificibacter marinus]SEL18114.1 4-azaleucine resistance probable transporter AzlC [Pacificibacter marinus]SLN63567.1 Inner membrane protein YgaZ [Pacificibacter marinus]
MPTPRTRHPFVHGALDSLPFFIVIVPFGALFGVIATEAGMNIAQVMGFSILVIAGASQLTALQLLIDNAPTVVVIVTALAVNMRMAMYSASLTPHLGANPLWKRALAAYCLYDQPFALATVEFEKRPDRSPRDKLTYFLGAGVPLGLFWYIATFLGAILGEKIPSDLGVDFAVPVTFLAVVAPMLKSLAHVAAAATSVVLVLVFSFMPYGTGLLVAAVIALVVGALVEIWTEKQRKTQ